MFKLGKLNRVLVAGAIALIAPVGVAQLIESEIAASNGVEAGFVLAEQEIVENEGAEKESLQEQTANTEAIKDEKQRIKSDLDQQFAKLHKTLETADAYSLDLAEDYFSYARLLNQDGQYEEAIEAFTKAMHIQKVNHGIYATEQRPALKEIFEIYFSQGSSEESEEYLDRILWIESKNPGTNTDDSFYLLLRLGNHFLDQYLQNSRVSDIGISRLERAKILLGTAHNRYRGRPLSDIFLPYGELALISYLEYKLERSNKLSASQPFPARYSPGGILQNRQRLSTGQSIPIKQAIPNTTFPFGKKLLLNYYRKALREKNSFHLIEAFISLGDYHLLFGKYSDAKVYYQQALNTAQGTEFEEQLAARLAKPQAIPEFNYALPRNRVLVNNPIVTVPVSVSLKDSGKVRTVSVLEGEDESLSRYSTQAKRITRDTVFRPAFVDGEPQATEGFLHHVKIKARPQKKQNQDSQNQENREAKQHTEDQDPSVQQDSEVTIKQVNP